MAAPLVPVPSPAAETLTIRPWPDPVIDSLGHDPRSHYVETYWLGILGPSTSDHALLTGTFPANGVSGEILRG